MCNVDDVLYGYSCPCLWVLFAGVFVARGREDTIVTKNMAVGEAVYGEKRIRVEVRGICLVQSSVLCSVFNLLHCG